MHGLVLPPHHGQTEDFLTLNHLSLLHDRVEVPLLPLTRGFVFKHGFLFKNFAIIFPRGPQDGWARGNGLGWRCLSASTDGNAGSGALGELCNGRVPGSSAGALWALEPGQFSILPTSGITFLTCGKEKAGWVFRGVPKANEGMCFLQVQLAGKQISVRQPALEWVSFSHTFVTILKLNTCVVVGSQVLKVSI